MIKILTVVLAVSLSPIAFAADSLDGCGLGWQVTDKKTYTATLTRGTTNAFVPPTFGMTTGTIGCDQLEIGQNDKEAADYVATNYETLKTELASGRGEYVDALAKALGCSSQSAQLGQSIQSNYDSVVQSADNSLQLFQNLKKQSEKACI